MTSSIVSTLASVACFGVLTVPTGTLSAQEKDGKTVSYSRDVRPILSEKCFLCHGRDPSSRKAKLRLDKAEHAFAHRKDGSPPVIIKGDPGKSELVFRIKSEDEDEIMPPPEHKKPLTPEETGILERWIAEGADYEGHWSFTPPKRAALPEVDQESWKANPVDRFLYARMKEEGLTPNGPTDRRTLIRRLSFDLTGLPPTPEETDAFVDDKANDGEAYKKLIDKLFQSPHYGEHMARYWLDAARYGDTHGLHLDNYREMWPYRDWVIAAFNANMPFDQFTIEQLAGDLLPNPTLDQKIATGFSRCNVTTSEGGAIDDEYNAIYAKDRVATLTKVWMGLAADCASCHDHKFDPLMMKDFYKLTAYFRNTTQKAMDGNAKDTPPNVFVPLRADRKRWFAIDGELKSLEEKLKFRASEAMPDFANWQKGMAEEPKVDVEGLILHMPLAEGEGGIVKSNAEQGYPIVDRGKWVDGFFGKALQFADGGYVELGDIGDFERDQEFSYGAWLRTPGKATGAAIARMDRDDGHRGWDMWIQNDRVAVHFIYNWPEDYLKVTTKAALEKDKWTHVFATYDGSSKPGGVKIYFDGEEQELEVEGKSLNHTIRTSTSLKLGRRSTGQAFRDGGLHDFRLYGRSLASDEVSRLAKSEIMRNIAALSDEERTKEQRDALLRYYLDDVDSAYRALKKRREALEKERRDIRTRGATTLVMDEKPGEPFAHVLRRGEYDQPGEKVAAGVPEAMPPLPESVPNNRLGLAKWLLEPDHPLPARVTVNRLWQQLFGTGIVATAGEFGTMGERPTHPELLDWLAVEFRESGWNIQHMLRLMVLSSAYRQSSDSTPEKTAKDPGNRLLARGPRYRLDAEMIRDQALAASGLLVPRIGGPSVKPYQPDGVWFAVGYTRSNTARFVQDHGDKLYRRSLYTFWKRTAAPPSMEVFNAPAREFCVVQRERTNTPLQALTLMNDPQIIEAARHLATNTIKACGDNIRGRVNHITLRVLARKFDDDEFALISQSIRALDDDYQADPAAAKELISIGESKPDPSIPAQELAAWTMVASQILNFDEAITKN